MEAFPDVDSDAGSLGPGGGVSEKVASSPESELRDATRSRESPPPLPSSLPPSRDDSLLPPNPPKFPLPSIDNLEHLPLNDSSVLPSFNHKDLDVVNGGDDGAAADLMRFERGDGEDRGEEEGRLVDAWNRWQDHRGSSRLRLSATPNDPEEDDDHENSERCVSGIFANTSSNPSVMNSLMLQQEVNKQQQQQATSSYASLEHQPQQQQRQHFPSTTSSTTLHTVATSVGGGGGFNMRQYEEELVKLRNDNFSLKLRIRLLEERQGLELRPGDDSAKENVFGVNLDLRVEKATLKQQIEEKDKLLRDAYLAIQDMELREKELEKILAVNSTTVNHGLGEATAAMATTTAAEAAEDDSINESHQRELLLKAFGSMDLGSHTEDAASSNEKEKEEKEAELVASLRNSEARVEKLEKEVEAERETVRELRTALSNNQEQVVELLEAKESLENELKSAKEDFEAQIVETNGELEVKHMECVNLRQEFDAKEEQIVQLLERIQILESDAVQHNQLSELSGQESDNLQRQMAILKSNFLEEKASRDEEWREKCHALSAKVDAEAKRSEAVRENLVKTQLGVTGLSEVNAELKQQVAELQSGVEARDKALAILRDEYEKVKTKYRKIKAAGGGGNNVTQQSTVLQPAAGQSVLQSVNLSNSKRRSGSSVGSRTSCSTYETAHDDDKENNYSGKENHLEIVGGGGDFTKEELRLSKKEVELLKEELKVCKGVFLRSGASKAVQVMEKVYKGRMQKVEGHHGRIVGMMRKRLEELADCLQKLLTMHQRLSAINLDESLAAGAGNSLLMDVSVMSESLLDASRSFLQMGGTGDGNSQEDVVNETQLPESVFKFPTEEVFKQLSETGIDRDMDEDLVDEDGQEDDTGGLSPVTVKMMVGKRLKEYENLMVELRDSSKRRANAEGQAMSLKRELDQAEADREALKLEASKAERKANDLTNLLTKSRGDALELQNQLADTNAVLEQLRIKNGQLKESLMKAHDENGELRSSASKAQKMHQVTEKLRQTEAQHAILLEKYAKSKEYAELLLKEVASYKETEALLKAQLEAADDTEDIRRQLEAAEAEAESRGQKLAKYQERQAMMEKALKQELAKTHVVLKKTKAALASEAAAAAAVNNSTSAGDN